jgi:hypothetical protein
MRILLSPLVGDSIVSHLSGKIVQFSVPTTHVYLTQVNRTPVNAFDERYGVHITRRLAFYQHFVSDALNIWREYSEVLERSV